MTLRNDWSDPGHDLPEVGTYRDLDCWVDHKGRVYVGNRAIEVVSRAAVTRALAALYSARPTIIAALCDDHLDRSGRMLGEVRQAARATALPGDQA